MSRTIVTPEIVPARMLNEMAYCPRLAYLEWVQGEFADSADTVDGRFRHRRVDQPSGDLPEAPLQDEGDDVINARSVLLSDEDLGATARIEVAPASATVISSGETDVTSPGGASPAASSRRQSKILIGPPRKVVCAPGCGLQPRMRS